jgi:outer membrane protein assembly factor BamD (BamD/ComL family)
MRHRWYRTWQRIGLIAALLCGLTSCAAWPSAEVSSKPHDKVLFEKAMSAMRQKQFTVANLTLQTLVNTYPESNYARKARVVLQDPQIAKCGQSWSTDPDCDNRISARPSSTP